MEELQTRLTKYLDFLDTTAKDGTDFLIEQAPLVVQDFLTWEFWHHILYGVWLLIIPALLLAALICGWIALYRYYSKGDAEHGEPAIMGLLGSFIGLAIIASISTCGIKHWLMALKIHVAPRVYLLEHIREFIK